MGGCGAEGGEGCGLRGVPPRVEGVGAGVGGARNPEPREAVVQRPAWGTALPEPEVGRGAPPKAW